MFPLVTPFGLINLIVWCLQPFASIKARRKRPSHEQACEATSGKKRLPTPLQAREEEGCEAVPPLRACIEPWPPYYNADSRQQLSEGGRGREPGFDCTSSSLSTVNSGTGSSVLLPNHPATTSAFPSTTTQSCSSQSSSVNGHDIPEGSGRATSYLNNPFVTDLHWRSACVLILAELSRLHQLRHLDCVKVLKHM